MFVRHARDLRQMRDAEHLLVSCDIGNAFGDHLRRPSADACVDLVKDHTRARGVACGDDRLDRERNARELTARSDLLERFFRFADVRGKEHLQSVCAAARIFILRRDLDMKPCLAHAELLQFALNIGGKAHSDLFPARGEFSCTDGKFPLKCGNLLVELRHIRVVILDGLQLLTHGYEPRENGGHRSAIFLFQAVDHVHPHLDVI